MADIIDFRQSNFSNLELPHVVYYSCDHSTTPVCTEETQKLFNCVYTLATDWHSLIEILEQGYKFMLIRARDIEKSGSSVYELVGMIDSLIKFISASRDLRIGVVINKDTNLKLVKDIQKTSITNLLLDVNDFPLDDVLELNDLFLKGQRSWPKHIISTLPGNQKKKKEINLCQLTKRQEEVLPLICNRGLSNKQIAKVLSISESTVKIHVSAIMKAYAVRNRTQLALAAASSLKA